MSPFGIRPLLSPIRRELVWGSKRLEALLRSASGKKVRGLETASVEVVQILPPAASPEKLSNLRLGMAKISRLSIAPGAVFSFWLAVGRPGRRQGFMPSRSIVNGKLQNEVGGGLCQLSGLVFHLALLAGLKVLERHSHSLDIYREEERFAPLGLDAAVVFPTKDLMLLNSSKSSIRFDLELVESDSEISVIGRLKSDGEIDPRSVRVDRSDRGALREVLTRAFRRNELEAIFRSSYRAGHG